MGAPKRPWNSRNSPKRVKAVERQRQAMQLRIAGATYAQIGAQLGITAFGAQKAVEAGLREHTKEAATKLLPLELERLDRLQLAWWSAATNGDYKAAEIVLKVVERRCKLLGMEAPTRVDTRLLAHHEVDLKGGVMVIQADGAGGAYAVVGGDSEDYMAGLRVVRGDTTLALEGSSTASEVNRPQDDE